MKKRNLPEPEYYTIETLAEELECSRDTVLLYIQTGQLKASVQSRGWMIEYGWIEEDKHTWFSIPDDFKRYSGAPLVLSLWTAKALVQNGEVEGPQFEHNNYDYAHISSHHHEEEIKVHLNEIIIQKDHLNEFLRTDKEEIVIVSESPSYKQKRRNELHECIKNAMFELGKASKSKLSPAQVMKYLKKNMDKDDYVCIQEIERCEDAGEEIIYWMSKQGVSQTMLYSTFRNVVSKFNKSLSMADCA